MSQGRLAAAASTDDGYRLARADIQVDTSQRLDGIITLAIHFGHLVQ